MFKRLVFLGFAGATLLALGGCGQHPSFSKDVHPVLKQHCAECHLGDGEGAKKSGFQVDSYDTIMKGTKFGAVVVPGDPASSSLYRLVSGKVDASIQMPHGKDPLPDAAVEALAAWIKDGAENN
jgi:hypothetical protein